MSSRFSHTSRFTKMLIIVLFCLVTYLLYSLTKNVYNMYQVDQYIADFEEENKALEMENQQMMDDYLYFTSDEYFDKIAKQNLGLVNDGEQVIILSDVGIDNEETIDELSEETFARFDEMSNPGKWWQFFFGV